jgi:hypothetical protein
MMNYQMRVERERLVRYCLAPQNQSLKSRLIGGWNRFWIKLRRIYG